MGQIFPLSVWQRVTLIAAGAGGGIAATFNTPVGGVLFAVEIMMAEVSVRTLVPVAISTATATYIGRIIFGDTPSFIIPKLQTHYFHLTQPEILLAYVGLGLIAGVVSALYIKSIYGFEDLFEKKIKGSYYFRHMTGMLLVGIIMTVMMLTLGHYYTEGVGYATIQDILSSHSPVIWILLLLFALKLLAVSLTLGSGASGGIFSPGLFMGATLGGAYGIVLDKIFPGGAFHPAAFAVAGMAGLIGGSTGAALTAIVMIFEMTLDYNVIIPMTITVALSYGVSRLLSRETIYTLKLVRRGHYMPEALQTNFHHLQRVKDICEREFGTVDADTSLTEFSDLTADHPDFNFYLVRDKDTLIGIASRHVPLDYLGRPHQSHLVRDIMMTDFVSAGENERLFELMVKMRLQKVSMGVVTSDGRITSANDVKGLITQRQIARALEEAVELFSE